jgi:signal recognition particle subunit SRP54
MFDALTARLTGVFDRLRGRGVLREENITEALREVRRALLEADVHVRVARTFIENIRESALGETLIRGVNPGQQLIRIVHDELIQLLGGEDAGPEDIQSLKGRILLLGLQGSGKTTFGAKLALRIEGTGRRAVLLGLDTSRPAAGDQLARLAESVGVSVRLAARGADPVRECAALLAELEQDRSATVIIDTAGRQTVDEELMEELNRLHQELKPDSTILILDAMTGQDAVKTAEAFAGRIPCTGAALTKLDGDARGGAALSLRAVTGLPILYAGIGEGLDALERFQPERMAGRILGMGDVITLVEKAAAEAGGTEALAEEGRRLVEGEFTLSDFREQIRRLRSMGPIQDLAGMLPGALGKAMSGVDLDEGSFVALEAMIDSMTLEERRRPSIIDGSRRQRIARGSGRTVQEVNGLLKQYAAMQKMAKALRGKGRGRKGRLPFPPM